MKLVGIAVARRCNLRCMILYNTKPNNSTPLTEEARTNFSGVADMSGRAEREILPITAS